MLRGLLALLLLANLGFLAWTEGLLGELLPRPDAQREPERLQRQVQPEQIRLGRAQLRAIEPGQATPPASDLTAPPAPAVSSPSEPAAVSSPLEKPAAASAAASPSPARPASAVSAQPAVASRSKAICLEAGPYTEAELARVQPLLERSLPSGSWRLESSERPAAYVVYSGRYPDRASLQQRQDELRQLNVEFIEMREPSSLAMGLSLGRFRHRENAERHVGDLEKRGVRGVRVVPVGPPVPVYRVQLPAADSELQTRLAQLPSRQLLGREFGTCTTRENQAARPG